MNTEEKIVSLLKEKACTKQKIYRITKNIFANFQDVLQEKANILNNEFKIKMLRFLMKNLGILMLN